MALNKKFFPKVSAAAADTFTPSEHFNTVLYTGNGGTQKIGGYINRGAVFNGSSSYIDLGNNSSNNGSLISVSCWFRTTSTSAAQIWNNGGNDSSSTGLALKTLASGVLYFQANTGGTSVNDTGTTTINDGDWHHVVVNYDNGDFNVYLDGSSTAELTGTSSAFTTTANQNFIIGRLSRVATDYFNGVIDQFRIFNRELTASEVTTLYGETHSSTTISTTDIFSDNSGVALYQLDGNANDTGGASGKFGASGIFNGSSSYISTPNPLGTGNVAYSISAWINLNSSSHTGGIYTIWDSGTTAGTYLFFKVESGSISIGNYGSTVTSSNTLSTNQWVHVVVTRDTSNNVVLYVNGASDTTGTLSLNLGNHSAKIGALASSTQNFNGRIDDVRIYSDVLTSTEIGYIYNNTTASIPTDNLTAYYKLNGDARDETVPSYDGTASNVTYAYDGTASNVTYQEATKFQPDFVWIKGRSFNIDHAAFDSVRGAQKYISPSTTGSEGTFSTVLTSFDSNGFTVGSNAGVNKSSETYVAWCFNAGSGSETSGTGTGSITNVAYKANTDAGFSIVKYTGSGSVGTVTHGLNSKPDLIIFKNRGTTGTSDAWPVYSTPTTADYSLYLYANYAAIDDANNFNDTEPTDSVFTVGTWNGINKSGIDFIAYCFHDVAGYQKIGSYTGTGTSNGNFVETGFEPAFLMVKITSGSDNWIIVDNKRDASNPRNTNLKPNSSAAEADEVGTQFNFYSDGFQSVGDGAGEGQANASGSTYLYLAIAADPDTTTPTVADSFDVVTYTGNGSTQEIETDFKPDLVWIKQRNDSEAHFLQDSVRGSTKTLYSSGAFAEVTEAQGVTSFDSGGFTLGSYAGMNGSSDTYVAWCWKAGENDDNLPQINTEGSIDSIVSVNDEAGFSIVKYTGNETASQTVGHGLSSSPEIAFIKQLDGGRDWIVPLFTQTSGDYLHLNTTAAEATDTNKWSAVSSTTFTVGADPFTNGTGSPYIAYCWYSVTGHSKIGTYTGTGTTSNFTGFGFQPRWIMIKRTDSSGNWWIFDSERGNNKGIRANLSSAEDTVDADANTYEFRINFISDGFQYEIDNSTSPHPDLNVSGATHIYLAIA